MELKEFTELARALAQKSGEMIKPYFAGGAIAVETKKDRTIVTQADRDAEAVMREMIRKAYPRHGILGEEFGAENAAAEFVWTLDPIDGTVSFARGCPLFGTLIGLLHAGKPILGVIHNPALGQLCIGNNAEAMLNGRAVRVGEVREISDAMLLTTDVAAVAAHENKAGFDRLLARTCLWRTWGDCYGYLLVACGGADIMLDPMMNPWDVVPLVPIVRGAGGVITTWSGADAAQGGSCVAANKVLHPRVIETLNS
ncbi:MAG TPA: histidinol-phosphatase [Candidatus Binatia bacterium]|jgi:myo-inositol-1(or 4)-monophosphatase